jgi:serine/threonine protein kinase
MAVERIGRYRITGEIGSGGFGRVYSAQDPSVGRTVAIKVMNAPGDTDLARRFRTEAMTVASLAHKNIVTVHEYGEQDGAPYLVMEYLEGVNLQELIKQGALTLLEKVEIMTEVADGLFCAHRQGITHRDVKPANIMRLADGSVKIMDFGIARIGGEGANRLTQTGFIVGTWSYMAPEQFNGTSDPLSDIFAYGVTFYELLTGRNPFSAPDPAGVFSRITTVEPPPVSTYLPGCPEDLDRLIQKTIAKDRSQRYGNLQDVVVDAKPILFDLRRAEAVHTFAQASQLLASRQFEAAQSAVRKALELDPTHSGARQLRSQIEKEVQRRDSTARAETLLEKAERELRDHQYQEASSTLASVRPYVPSDSPLTTRLMRADAQIETARRVAKLLDVARDNLRRLDYTEAFRSVSEALTADPSNSTGKALMQEIQTGMNLREARRRMQEELARAEGLLLTGETEQARALLQELEAAHPGSPEIASLRQRAEAQWAEENRRLRLSSGVAECKALVRNQQFEEAVSRANLLLADFPDNVELQNLLRHATDRLGAKKRAEQIARLKNEAAAYISRQEYDFAIKLLETGVAKLGDDGELTRMLQSAIAGKEAMEREHALAQVSEDARRLRRQGKFDDAIGAIEKAIQVWGDAPQLQNLLREIAAERREAAVREVARRAKAVIDQGNPDDAAAALGECLKRHGEDSEIRRLLQAAESQIQSRQRDQRVKSILEAVRKLAGSRRWQEALQRIDEGLRQFPGDAALTAERRTAVAAIEAEEREQERVRLDQEKARLEQQRQVQEQETRRQQEALRRQEEERARRAAERAEQERRDAERAREIAASVQQVQSAREKGLAEAATEILNAAFIKHGRADALVQEQQKLSDHLAEVQRNEAIQKGCEEARSLRKLNQFDEALRALDALAVRYPGAPAIATLRAEIERDRAAFRQRKEIEDALAAAAELVQKGQTRAGLELLENAIKSHPGSTELKEAAARVKARLEEEEHQHELSNVTGAIEKAILAKDWNRAVNQATGAFAKFPGAEEVARLKRQAEEGKQRKDVEDEEGRIVKTRDSGNLEKAAELAAAARIRWEREKRFQKLEEEIAEARAEKQVAAAQAQANAEKLDEAERLVRQALKLRPNLPSATDLLAAIAARREARQLRLKQEADSRAIPVVAAPANNLKKYGAIGAGAVVVIAVLIFLLAKPSPKPPVETGHETGVSAASGSSGPSVSTGSQTSATTPSTPVETSGSGTKSQPASGAATITVIRAPNAGQAVRGQEYQETIRASGASGRVNWTVVGSLPSGLTIEHNSGHIRGKVTAPAGSYTVIVTASDGNGAKGQLPVAISVVEPAAAVSAGPAPGTKTQPSTTTTPNTTPPPPVQCKPYDWANYNDIQSGDLTWNGSLDPTAQVEIRGKSATPGSVRGDGVPKNMPVRISISPATVRAAKEPSQANCWDSQLVLQNTGQAVQTIKIHWEALPH